MSIHIVEVTRPKELNEFIRFPWQIYNHDPYWVPPLLVTEREFYNRNANPFFSHARVRLFVAVRNNTIVGRISANIDENYISFHGERTGGWGSFECINDPAAAAALFDAVEAFFKEHAVTISRGPLTFTTNHTCGLLIEGFDDPPAIMMPYNPRYYRQLIEDAGYSKAKDLLAFIVETNQIPDKINRDLQNLKDRFKINIRRLNLKKFKQEVALLNEIYNRAWEKNWGFVPMTEDEFWHEAKNMKSIAEEEYLLIAERNGKPAGFMVALPDYNQIFKSMNGRLLPFGILKIFLGRKKITRARTITLGVIPRFRKIGVDMLLIQQAFLNNKNSRFTSSEMSWLLEDNNAIITALEHIGGKRYKTYRVFEKKL